MQTLFTGQYCIKPESADSTSSHLLQLSAVRDLPEGTAVWTLRQEQGRGQRGASWVSEPGKNLTLSLLFKPVFLRPEDQFGLSKAMALGVHDFVIDRLFPSGKGQVKVKWPNDIYIGDNKTAGILIENAVSGNALGQSIVGIGINVNQEIFPKDIPNPVSLKTVTGRSFDLQECFEGLCSCLEARYLQLKNKPGQADSDYLASLYRYDTWADYSWNGKKIKARISGVASSGKLMLETGQERKIECDIKELAFL